MTIGEELFQKLDQIDRGIIYEKMQREDPYIFREWMQEDGVPESRLHEYVLRYMERRRPEFRRELLANASESNGRLLVYRCISVADPEAYLRNVFSGSTPEGFQGLGIYWTWDAGSSYCLRSTGVFVLTAEVPFDSIDLETTAIMNYLPGQGSQEREIRIKKGFPVWLSEIYSFGSTRPWSMQPPKRFKA